jgi:DNA-binding winged helix-turn-helix (wHTH) protein
MRYQLNTNFLFDSDTRMMCQLDGDGITYELSNYASRALEVLINNNGCSVTREYMFSAIWLEDESRASNASLNNYISEIRKCFVALQLDHRFLKTIPRYGFKLELDVQESMPTKTPAGPTEMATKKTKKIILTFPILLFIAIALGVILYITFNKNILPPKIGTYLYTDKKCRFFSLGTSIIDLERIKKSITDEDINCNKSNRDIIVSEGLSYNTSFHSRLISICDRIDHQKYSNCVNIRKVYSK